MTRIQVLEETTKLYDLNNRAVVAHQCQYSPPSEGALGCAIGRLLPPWLAHELDCSVLNQSVKSQRVFAQLPPEVQELGQEFLYDLQRLHDNTENWTEDGLSPIGEALVAAIKGDYELK